MLTLRTSSSKDFQEQPTATFLLSLLYVFIHILRILLTLIIFIIYLLIADHAVLLLLFLFILLHLELFLVHLFEHLDLFHLVPVEAFQQLDIPRLTILKPIDEPRFEHAKRQLQKLKDEVEVFAHQR